MRPFALAAFFAVGLFLACGTPINVDVEPGNDAIEAGADTSAVAPIADAGDGGTPSKPDAQIFLGGLRVVQTAYTATMDPTTSPAFAAPVQAGNLIIVAIANLQDDAGAFTSDVVTGTANQFVQVDPPKTPTTSCGCSTTMWYAALAAADTQAVTVKVNAGSSQIWMIEAAGIAEPAVLSTPANGNTSTALGPPDSGLHVLAPQVGTTVAKALVVSAACSCAKIEDLETTGFTPIPMSAPQKAAAYTITTEAGSYGAMWSSGDVTQFAATTTVFKL